MADPRVARGSRANEKIDGVVATVMGLGLMNGLAAAPVFDVRAMVA